jgi:hypothetical protein
MLHTNLARCFVACHRNAVGGLVACGGERQRLGFKINLQNEINGRILNQN